MSIPRYEDLYNELSQEAAKFPAEPGDIKDPEGSPGAEEFIAGRIVETGVWRSNEYGDCVTFVVQDEKTGPRIHYASSSIMRRFVEERPPRVGDYVGVFYGGLRPLRAGGHYHHYQPRHIDEGGDETLPSEPSAPMDPDRPADEDEAAEPSSTDEPGEEGGDDIPF